MKKIEPCLFSLGLFALVITACSGAQKKADSVAPTEQKQDVKSVTHVTKAPEGAVTAVVCKKGSDVRTIEVLANSTGCAVNYMKAQKEQTMAQQKFGNDHCIATREKIKGNLTKSGFVCE